MEATFAQPKVVRGRGGGAGGHTGEFGGRGIGASKNKHWEPERTPYFPRPPLLILAREVPTPTGITEKGAGLEVRAEEETGRVRASLYLSQCYSQ